MNRDKAKAILQCCPPNAGSRSDPELREAFEVMAGDKELAAWFEREQEFDLAFSTRLKSVSAPPGLREDILSAAAATVTPVPWLGVLYAAAAMLVFALGLALFFARHDGSDSMIGAQFSPEFPFELISYFEREAEFDQLSGNLAEVRSNLKAQGGPETEALPASFEDMTRYRCRIYKRETQKVALICMQRDEQRMHLFVIEEKGSPARTARADDRPVPRFTQRDPWAFADWGRSGKTYVLATQGSTDDLRLILSSQ